MNKHDQLYTPPALPPGKEPPVLIGFGTWRAVRGSYGEVKNLASFENYTPAVQPVVRRYTPWAIPPKLSPLSYPPWAIPLLVVPFKKLYVNYSQFSECITWPVHVTLVHGIWTNFTNKDWKFPRFSTYIHVCQPPLWSSDQGSWLQIQRSRVRFKALPDFLRSSGSGTGFIQPVRIMEELRTWKESSGSGLENRN
jgi:hypothetical protein